MLVFILAGCGGKKGGYVSLANKPIAEEQIYKISDGKAKINFELPNDGYLKISAYDCTEYDESSEESSKIFAQFFDEKGKLIYGDINVTNGYFNKFLLKKGTASVILTVKNNPEKAQKIAVSWGYAEESDKISEINENETVTAKVGKDNKAQFKFVTEKSEIYSIGCSEACLNESDCSFTVFDANGKSVTKELFIHPTEWISRKVFLPKGEYTISVDDVFSVATCTVKSEKIYKNIASSDDKKLKVPVDIGFLTRDYVTTEFEANGGKLVATAIGTGSYYDSEQNFKVEITDESGTVLFKEKCEGALSWDIPKEFGKGFVKLTVEENCVISLNID